METSNITYVQSLIEVLSSIPNGPKISAVLLEHLYEYNREEFWKISRYTLLIKKTIEEYQKLTPEQKKTISIDMVKDALFRQYMG